MKRERLPECIQMLEKKTDCPRCRHVESVFQRHRKPANIHADSGFI
jgi:transcription elongation factor Elf1